MGVWHLEVPLQVHSSFVGGGLRLSPLKCCRVIVVTAMLHNIAVHLGADEPPPVDDEEEHSEDEAPNPAPAMCEQYSIRPVPRPDRNLSTSSEVQQPQPLPLHHQSPSTDH